MKVDAGPAYLSPGIDVFVEELSIKLEVLVGITASDCLQLLNIQLLVESCEWVALLGWLLLGDNFCWVDLLWCGCELVELFS